MTALASVDDKKAPLLDFPSGGRHDPEELIHREWLVTNGLGGYGSGTVLGVGTRRYHGFFIPDLPAPYGRTVIIPRLDEEILTDGHPARLAGCEYADGRLEADAHMHLKDFRLEWGLPSWTFEVGDHLIEKTIFMPYGLNSAYAVYRLLRGEAVRLHMRPYFTFRMNDAKLFHPPEWPFAFTISRGRHEVHPFEGAPPVRLCFNGGVFVAEPKTNEDVFYRIEKSRGYDHAETLMSPGYASFDLRSDRPAVFCASAESWQLLQCDADEMLRAERSRREKLLNLAPPEARTGFAAQLVLAADQFITLPGTRVEENLLVQASGEQARTVIAGYHWFTDWGRDTMISLEGLTLCTGRYREARAILRTFSHYFKDGLLPNLFPEGQREALYHTADATFWYFHALDRYHEATKDLDTVRALYPTLKAVVQHHVQGTRFGIGADRKDGLVHAGADGYQLTWMDAKVGGWVVTPRRGKPVEIQALWHNALRLMVHWGRLLGEQTAPYEALAETARRSFNARFWNEKEGHLFDVLDGPDGAADPSLRPNQIFSISLRFPVLDEKRWAPVFEAVTRKLLTPYGLRTLDPAHKEYRPKYEGDIWARDAAYHQGLVWTWLIGHYLDARRKVHPESVGDLAPFEKLERHLREAGLGTISEIFDAEPPHVPRGCIAQAWSVAEVLRSYLAALRARDDWAGVVERA